MHAPARSDLRHACLTILKLNDRFCGTNPEMVEKKTAQLGWRWHLLQGVEHRYRLLEDLVEVDAQFLEEGWFALERLRAPVHQLPIHPLS